MQRKKPDSQVRVKDDWPGRHQPRGAGDQDVPVLLELEKRSTCLNSDNITTVGQLALKTEAEMLKYRNF